MVKITDQHLVIEVPTTSPDETLLEFQHGLIGVMQQALDTPGGSFREDFPTSLHFTLELLRHLLPGEGL